MSIIKCSECGGDVSDKAKSCPHCGYELQQIKQSSVTSEISKQSETVSDNGGWKRSAQDANKMVVFHESANIRKKKTNVLGVLSVVFGIIGLLSLNIIWCIIGVVLAIVADKKVKNTKSPKIGVTISIIAFVISLIASQVQPYIDKNKEDQTQETTVESNQKQNKDTDQADDPKNKDKKEMPQKTEKPKTAKQIKKEYIKSCKEYSYKKVLRNPDKYIGKRVKVKLKISSVHEKGILTPTKYYFANAKDTYGWYGDQYGVFEKRDSEKPKLLEDDIVEVYGEIAEPEETKSLIVNSSEIFTIDMKYVKLVSGK